MKKVCILVFTLVLLGSCNVAPSENKTIEEVVSTGASVVSNDSTMDGVEKMDIQDVLGKINPKFTKEEGFLTCVQNQMDSCITEIGYRSETKISCSDFILESNQKSCRETEIMTQAREQKDVTICEKSEAGKEQCKYEIAVMLGDNTICSGLSEDFSLRCKNAILTSKARETKDKKVCEKLENPYKPQGGEDQVEVPNIEQEICEQEVEIALEIEKMEKEHEEDK